MPSLRQSAVLQPGAFVAWGSEGERARLHRKKRDNPVGIIKHKFVKRSGDLQCGPQAYGECHWHAKITEQDVVDIIRASKSGESNVSIASRYPISRQAVYKITKRKRWAHMHNTFVTRNSTTVGCSEPERA